MRALVYHAPYDVRIDDKPRPRIQAPDDLILKVTTTAICGSDLHFYHGSMEIEPGLIPGHEFMDIVEETGPDVHKVKKGDRVVIPFSISCGQCWFCRRQLWSKCDRSAGAVYGFTSGYDGGQAEYALVKYGNVDPLKVPDNLKDEEVIFLSDVLCTGYYAADVADVQAGDDVAVFGAGPVGYFAVMSCFLRGAARVFSIDRIPARLKKTEVLGAETINFDKEDPVKTILDATRGRGTVCIDAVGYEAVGHSPSPRVQKPTYENQNPLQAVNWIAEVVRKASSVGIPGVYVGQFQDFPLAQIFNKGLQLKLGGCPVKKYDEQLLHLIELHRIDPTKIISHTMKLEEAPKAYKMFDEKDGVTKVILKP